MDTEPKPDSEFLNSSVKQAYAWRVSAEIIRRHPFLYPIETHAGGGQYDELQLVDTREGAEALVSFNYVGRVHFGMFLDTYVLFPWTNAFNVGPYRLVRDAEKAMKLDPPDQIPVSTKRVLTTRVIAALLAERAFGRDKVGMVNGRFDSSAWGAGDRTELFAEFPRIGGANRQPLHDDPLGEAAYHFWFLYETKEEKTENLLAFDLSTGRIAKPGENAGKPFNIERSYKSCGRNFDALMVLVGQWRLAD